MSRLAIAVGAIVVCGVACGGEPAKMGGELGFAEDANLILDLKRGSFRAFVGWKTPVLISPDGKLKPLLEPKRGGLKDEDRKPVPVRQSDPPPPNWASVDFDDSVWPRVRDPRGVGINKWDFRGVRAPNDGVGACPLEGHRVCLRGKFRVADPGKVKDLKLVLRYHGGAVVYVNGKELCRGHLPEGKIEPDTLATRYADEAYVSEGGKIRPGMSEDPKVIAELVKVRDRELTPKGFRDGVGIPGSMLRKGVNVVAIEVHTAPVHEQFVEEAPEGAGWKGSLRDRQAWLHAMVVHAQVLSAWGASGTALTGNVSPSSGIEVGATQPIETDYAYDFAHASESPAPIHLVGARNGTFSGKVTLSSAGAIENLKATASELVAAGSTPSTSSRLRADATAGTAGQAGSPQASGKGKIPASAVQVRLAERARPEVSWARPTDFDRLLGEFPATIAPAAPDRTRPASAVAPVWVTIKVPSDAAAGEYRGTLSIQADGPVCLKSTVPIQLKVHDWRIPDPKDFVTHNHIYQSPDSVAQYYKVPLWSARHFELMGKSLKVFQEVGNKICLVNLVVRSPGLNNTESMVRWVRKEVSGVSVQVSGSEKKDGSSAPDTRNLKPFPTTSPSPRNTWTSTRRPAASPRF